MRAIILAAGRGSRLLHLTDDRPKCLAKLHGRTLLAWQVSALRAAGIQDILVVGGYLFEQLSGEFETVRNPRWDNTNIVGSLLCARDWIAKGPCIVSYSDIVYPAEAILTLSEINAPLGILYDPNWLHLWQKRFADPLSDAESFRIREGLVTEIGRKNVSLNEIEGQYMGLLRFEPEVLQWMDAIQANGDSNMDQLDMTTLLQRFISDGRSVSAIPWHGRWCEVDDADDLAVATAIFAS